MVFVCSSDCFVLFISTFKYCVGDLPCKMKWISNNLIPPLMFL